jgi:hypothetical protein
MTARSRRSLYVTLYHFIIVFGYYDISDLACSGFPSAFSCTFLSLLLQLYLHSVDSIGLAMPLLFYLVESDKCFKLLLFVRLIIAHSSILTLMP